MPSAQSTIALPPRETIETELAARSLTEFVRQVWHVIEPGKEYVHNWHIDAIAEHLEAVTRGEIRRLLINVPFRFMKSTLVSVMWPAWTWVTTPAHQWLSGSYAMKLAVRDNLKMRRLIESPWYRNRWGSRFTLTSDQNQKVRFENDKTGYRIAFGMDAGVMGDGGDTVIVDDPHDRDQAHSEAERNNALTTFDEAIVTRLNKPAESAIVIIMQRLHEEDLSGHVLERGGWEHLLIPMHYEPSRSRATAIGWSDPRTVPGQLAWPERFPPDTVTQIQKAIGTYAAAGQLEQQPSPAEGGIIKRGWWKFYDALPSSFDELIQSWDFAVKDTGDYVVGQAWGMRGADAYLIDQVRDRLDMPASCHAVEAFSAKHPYPAKLVEDKANGPAVIAMLQHRVPGLIAVKPDGDKIARAHAVTPYIESGNVYIPSPRNAPWIHDFLQECSTFPNAAHDDQVDAMTQALHRLSHGFANGFAVVGFYDKYTAALKNVTS